MKKTISILFLFLASQLLFAGGGGSIKGNLIDPDGRSIIGATVFLYEGGTLRGTASDIDGKFNIKPITAGTYDVFVTSVEFDTLKISGVRVISDRITMLRNQKLQLKTVGIIDIVEYVWPIPLIDMDEPGAIVYDAETIEDLPGRNDINGMIADITPGVYQKEKGDPLQMRGSRTGASTYFIDGVKSSEISSSFPSSAIGTIRVFTGGIPAMYGDVVGGIVVIETKSFMSWYKKGDR
ncbi:MAG: hypothetical protein CL840_18095 [Crocinitomicaceae bacterium]|nr:hypothetical protein [Crocinitomicaceae bacterium]|tara:strand:- start:22879 stop:23589 length:711 start_codon:yes stop_codon:yes gene_type:complete